MRKTLEQNYSREESLYIYPGSVGVNKNWISNLEDLAELDKDFCEGLKVVMGHTKFGVHEKLGWPSAKYTVFLRNPVERIVSTYYHHKTHKDSPLYELLSQDNFKLEDFLKLELSALDNRMTRVVCGTEIDPYMVSQHDLEMAIENIQMYFEFVGLVERYEEGLKAIARQLNWKFGSVFDLNRTPDNQKKRALSSSAIEKILELNEFDYLLYRYVVKNYQKINRIN